MINRLIIGTLLIGAFIGCSDDSIPSTDEVKPALRSLLLAEKAKSCNGRVEMDKLSVTGVGDFEKRWGGWPVYATFAVTCYDGGNRTTWNSNDPSDKVMVCVVCKNAAGEYECFLPEKFRAAQE